MKVVAVVQCRLGSSRLPAKAALDFHGRTMLGRVIERCRLARNLADVVVATSEMPEDDVAAEIARHSDAGVHRGPLEDARQRLYGCARAFGADVFIRVTADNPFVDPVLIDALVDAKTAAPDCPYAVHDLRRTVYGTASELVDVGAMATHLTRLPAEGSEHVTTGLAELDGALRLAPDAPHADPELSLTVDTIEDYVSAWKAMHRFGSGLDAVPRIVAAFRSGAEADISFRRRG